MSHSGWTLEYKWETSKKVEGRTYQPIETGYASASSLKLAKENTNRNAPPELQAKPWRKITPFLWRKSNKTIRTDFHLRCWHPPRWEPLPPIKNKTQKKLN